MKTGIHMQHITNNTTLILQVCKQQQIASGNLFLKMPIYNGRLKSVDWTHWTGMVDWNGGISLSRTLAHINARSRGRLGPELYKASKNGTSA